MAINFNLTSAAVNFLFSNRAIGLYHADITKEESITDSDTVTEHPVENGSVISDNITSNPTTCTLQVAWSDSIVEGISIQDIYQQLLDLKDSHVPFTVVTGKRTLSNMVFTSIQNVTNADSEYILELSLEMKQLKIVDLQVVTISGSDATMQGGRKQATTITNKSTEQSITDKATQNTSGLYDLAELMGVV